VRAQILADAQRFDLQDMAIDRWQGHQLAMELQEEGITVVAMGQGIQSMAGPTKEIHRRLLLGKLHHGGNPCLRWQADGLAVKQDPAGNLKPDKSESQVKVDGMVALIMALDRAVRHEEGAVWEAV